MRVAVWDTYVQKKEGNTMHFDIIVPDTVKDAEIIYHYGKTYLDSKNENNSILDTDECQFCHIEEPSPDMIAHIKKQGFYILEMEEIPCTLPANPSRRDMILHLRAFYKQYRFADFKGKSLEEVQKLVTQS
jgi:Domain of unknown function (DUF2024)